LLALLSGPYDFLGSKRLFLGLPRTSATVCPLFPGPFLSGVAPKIFPFRSPFSVCACGDAPLPPDPQSVHPSFLRPFFLPIFETGLVGFCFFFFFFFFAGVCADRVFFLFPVPRPLRSCGPPSFFHLSPMVCGWNLVCPRSWDSFLVFFKESVFFLASLCDERLGSALETAKFFFSELKSNFALSLPLSSRPLPSVSDSFSAPLSPPAPLLFLSHH